MSRLCGRPGCSEPGVVAYGMVPEDLLFWVAALDLGVSPDSGLLCRRHADAMVVPRGWTLDDRREPVPRLFRPPPAVPTAEPAPRRRRRASGDETGQLELAPVTDTAPADTTAGTVTVAGTDTVADTDTAAGTETVPRWNPTFDIDDDLDGLLQVGSPLLARAFRGAGRPRG